MHRFTLCSLFLVCSWPFAIWPFNGLPVACAQFGDGGILPTDVDSTSAAQVPYESEKRTTRWRVGMTVEAVGGACNGLFGTVAVPTNWDDQKVRIIDEQISATVRKVRYRTLAGGVKQMLISIPRLPAGEKAEAIVTFEVDRYTRPLPAGAETFTMASRPDKEAKIYLAPSPFIESRHKQIRALADELTNPELSDWEQIERFYDYVREHVTYKNGKLKGALEALRDGDGDCEELTSLFIALCRAHGVPARTVWVPDHCYPEFYLVDENEVGHWLPCQAAGDRAFGTIPELRPILQKGDNFKVPEKKGRQRYVAEFLTGKAGGGKPRVRFVRDEIREPTR